MFTDTEIGLAMRHRRDMSGFANSAQALVDDLDADIIELRRQLKAANDALATERGLRRAAELRLARLNAILDTPLN